MKGKHKMATKCSCAPTGRIFLFFVSLQEWPQHCSPLSKGSRAAGVRAGVRGARGAQAALTQSSCLWVSQGQVPECDPRRALLPGEQAPLSWPLCPQWRRQGRVGEAPRPWGGTRPRGLGRARSLPDCRPGAHPVCQGRPSGTLGQTLPAPRPIPLGTCAATSRAVTSGSLRGRSCASRSLSHVLPDRLTPDPEHSFSRKSGKTLRSAYF